VVVLSLPITLIASVVLWFTVESNAVITTKANIGMLVIGISSMYLGFIPWYRGLKDAGTARGAQVQQLQVFLTLGWSVLLLDETIPASTLICSIGIVLSVTWAILSRQKPKVVEAIN
jgi:drug/metabolite transporter (DMT)-like permease